jgi:DNA-directed RNA polymerase II subunit RPB7
VTSVKPTGIFTLAGPLSVFIARKVCASSIEIRDRWLTSLKNIPSDIKWEPNTVPPQYTDHADQVIEKGTSLRLKILGVKPDVAAINAIGTIKEDYLG